MYEPANRVTTDNTKQPQNQKYYEDRPKHLPLLLLLTTHSYQISWYKSHTCVSATTMPAGVAATYLAETGEFTLVASQIFA